jgi:predicted RNA-binding protein with PUA domain
MDKLKGTLAKLSQEKAEELIEERLANLERELHRIYSEKEKKMRKELENERALLMIEVHETLKKEREVFELDRKSFTKLKNMKHQLESEVQRLKDSIHKKGNAIVVILNPL